MSNSALLKCLLTLLPRYAFSKMQTTACNVYLYSPCVRRNIQPSCSFNCLVLTYLCGPWIILVSGYHVNTEKYINVWRFFFPELFWKMYLLVLVTCTRNTNKLIVRNVNNRSKSALLAAAHCQRHQRQLSPQSALLNSFAQWISITYELLY